MYDKHSRLDKWYYVVLTSYNLPSHKNIVKKSAALSEEHVPEVDKKNANVGSILAELKLTELHNIKTVAITILLYSGFTRGK